MQDSLPRMERCSRGSMSLIKFLFTILLYLFYLLHTIPLSRVKQTTLIIHPPTVKQLDAAEYWSPVCLIFRCSLPKAMSISRSEILRKKRGGGGPEVEKLPSLKVLESPKAMLVSKSNEHI